MPEARVVPLALQRRMQTFVYICWSRIGIGCMPSTQIESPKGQLMVQGMHNAFSDVALMTGAESANGRASYREGPNRTPLISSLGPEPHL